MPYFGLQLLLSLSLIPTGHKAMQKYSTTWCNNSSSNPDIAVLRERHRHRRARTGRQRVCRVATAAPDGPTEDAASTSGSSPWQLNPYYTKKLERRTDALGNVRQDPSLVAEPLNWTADTKLSLAIRVVAKEAGVDEGVVRERVRLFQAVLPDGGLERGGVKLAELVRWS